MRSIPVLSVVLAGCAIVNSTGEHQGGEVPVERLCEDYAELGCRAHLDCCSTATITYEDCLREWIAACRTPVGPNAVSFESIARDPRTGYSPDAAARVLARGRELAASCDVGIIEWLTDRGGLSGALTGTVTGGGICMRGDSFALEALFSCADFSQSCRAMSPDWRCAPRIPGGGDESCYLDFDCTDDAYCQMLGPMLPGRCVTRSPDGGSCRDAAACQSLICRSDVPSGICVARDAESTYCSLSPRLGM